MARTNFVGRHEELALLDTLWRSPQATLLILYGRRRVGKTRLLTHWLKQHSGHGIYWVAEPSSALDQLRSFSQALYNFATPDAPAPLDFTYANWEQALRQVALLASNQHLALCIDELPYLIDVNPSITGILQKAWDHWLSKSNLILALSGSQMGMMQGMSSYEAPLYGRATAQVKLLPLPFTAVREYFPNYSAAERITLYAIWGGVPAYWERLNQQVGILDNIRDQLLASNTLMQEEPRLLLQDFINDPHNYVGILRAIAGGAHSTNRISTRTGLSKGHISKYLSVLRDTGFVAREVPITEDELLSRRGHYYVTDPYLRFYYHFLSAYQAKLALGEQQELLAHVERNLPAFIEDSTWKELCREWVLRASARGELPVSVQTVGGAWARGYDLTVVGLDAQAKHLIVGGCHWSANPATTHEVATLVSKTEALVPPGEGWQVFYLGFAAPGWTEEARRQGEMLAQAAAVGHTWRCVGLRLIDLEQLDADLSRWNELAQLSRTTG